MLIYLLTIFISVFLFRQLQVVGAAEKITTQRRSWAGTVLLFLVVFVLGFVVAWRNGVGTDYGNYIDIYSLSVGKTYSYMMEQREAFFGCLNVFCADVFDDYVPVFVICGFLTVSLIVYGIYKNSYDYALSAFLFIAGMYYFDLFNGMRQMISTGIMFAAFPLLKRQKWLWMVLLTYVAMQFHESSYVVFLAFLYARYVKPRSLINILLVVVFAVLVVEYDTFSAVLVDILIDTESSYSNYEDTLERLDLGANALRFGLAAVPPIFSVCLWKYLKNQGEDTAALVNLSVINACFMLLATRNWIFARFCMFFGIYNILLWPRILRCFAPKSRFIMTCGVVVVYFAYFWMIVHVDSNLLPYRSWLFGGTYA